MVGAFSAFLYGPAGTGYCERIAAIESLDCFPLSLVDARVW